jgi:hypothetical protein
MQWASPVAGGERRIALAYQERAGRYRLDRCATRAHDKEGAWTLSGAKSLVLAGDKADAFLVSAMAGDALALFLVERAATGAVLRAYGTLEGGRAAELQMEQTPAQLVSKDGLAALEHAVDIGIAANCAYAVGVMDKTLAITVEYMNTRKQFGVVISSFQALRHRIADMKMQLELARSMSYYASLKLNAPAAERRAAMARAKYQLGQSMRLIGQQAVQLHGGIGVTDEYIVSHYFKSLTQLEMAFGDSLFQLGEVSDRMQDSAGVFA